jgi:hypothetical protein
LKKDDQKSGKVQVKGGNKRTKKAASKADAKASRAGKKSVESAVDVKKTADKIAKYTPSKSVEKKVTPVKGGKTAKVAKRSVTGTKKQAPVLPSPSGKKSTKTTDKISMT